MSITQQEIESIAKRTAEIVLDSLIANSNGEISINDLCRRYGISKRTVQRRIAQKLLPEPKRRAGRAYFDSADILQAEFERRL